jgi:hypothetical protein
VPSQPILPDSQQVSLVHSSFSLQQTSLQQIVPGKQQTSEQHSPRCTHSQQNLQHVMKVPR